MMIVVTDNDKLVWRSDGVEGERITDLLAEYLTTGNSIDVLAYYPGVSIQMDSKEWYNYNKILLKYQETYDERG